jgi:hypothetical protein
MYGQQVRAIRRLQGSPLAASDRVMRFPITLIFVVNREGSASRLSHPDRVTCQNASSGAGAGTLSELTVDDGGRAHVERKSPKSVGTIA